jgi:hypothetical protein
VSVVATQNKRKVTFDIEPNAPMLYHDYRIMVTSETVPDRFDYLFTSWKFIYNESGIPRNLHGKMKGTITGSDRNWPKGKNKCCSFWWDKRYFVYSCSIKYYNSSKHIVWLKYSEVFTSIRLLW